MKSEKIILWVTVALVVLSLLFVIFLLPQYQEQIIKFSVDNPVLAPGILVLWRLIGVVIPPIPAGILAFTLIPIFGWFWVFLYSTIGLLSGAVIAFLLARKFREPLVKRFVPLQELNKWEGKLSDSNELWGFILIRMTTGPVMDFISYLAGLTKLSFGKFFFATLLSLIPSAIGYYVGETAYNKISTSESPFIVVGFLLGLGLLYFFYKGKIKEYRKKAKEKKTKEH
ncbi:MAG: TVP38/TMEM64 family protein [Candidatus Levybacteria bacterium]|nr:TVP38/TMEM64 family protein [Candidatus Levybacteria bacterium]